MKIIKLKGGSLNDTTLHVTNDTSFIRKSVNRKIQREYGYVRWYSQLKKLQRYRELFGDLVPAILDVGVDNDDIYFDIEYINGKDIKTLFKDNEIQSISLLNDRLWDAFDKMHIKKYSPNKNSLPLYFAEEVLQKINDARQFPEFESFYQIDKYEYNGSAVPGVKALGVTFEKLFSQLIAEECYVHGNSTLENIMYSEDTEKITFIDLYEEGIVDSKFMDYSQILQCSNSFYGILNDSILSVNENVITSDPTVPNKLNDFNHIFVNELRNRFTENEYRLIKLFELTQFFRMLPFKCHSGNIDAAKFFYAHGCQLINML